MFDRIMRWDEETGSVEESRSGAGYANGHTVDRAGRLVSCEQGNRRVTRTDHDGSVVVLADRFDADYDGHRGESEIGARHVFRSTRGVGRRRPSDGTSSSRTVWASRPTSARCTWSTPHGSMCGSSMSVPTPC